MLKKNIINILSFFVIFTICINFASAYSNIGLSLSKEKVSGCPGYAIPIELTISNNDDVTHTYTLSLELPTNWKIPDNGFIQPEVTLSSGESKKITFWINPPTVSPDVYSVKVKAKVGSEEETKTLQVEVLRCHDIKLFVSESINVCEDSEFKYIFEAKNNGKGEEKFDLIVSTSWKGEVYKETFSLPPSQSKNFAIPLISPTENGKISIKIASKTSYAKDEKYTQVNIEKCYAFEAKMEPKEVSVCLGKEAKFVLTLRNIGTGEDTYIIKTPSWIFAPKNVTIASNEEKSLEIVAYPELKGKSEFNITIESKGYPKLQKTFTGYVESKECKGVAVIISPNAQEACKGAKASFKVTVKNTGVSADSYDLINTLGELESKSVKVEAGDVKEIELAIDTNEMPFGEHVASVIAKSGDVSDQNSAKLLVKNCYDVDFAITPETKEICPNEEINYIFAVKNIGEFPDNYTFLLNNEIIGQASLSPKELGTYSIKVKMDWKEGENNLTFKVKSKYAEKEIVSLVKVKPLSKCYNVEIKSDTFKVLVEPGKGVALSVKIENTGEIDDVYAIELKGPEWVHITQNNIALKAGEIGTVYIYASPTYDVEKGVYNISLLLKSKNTEKEGIFRIGVGVEPEEFEEKEETGEISSNLPTGMTFALTSQNLKVLILALIILIIVIILAVKFILFIK
jgi:uncharacterized membrane protein